MFGWPDPNTDFDQSEHALYTCYFIIFFLYFRYFRYFWYSKNRISIYENSYMKLPTFTCEMDFIYEIFFSYVNCITSYMT